MSAVNQKAFRVPTTISKNMINVGEREIAHYTA